MATTPCGVSTARAGQAGRERRHLDPGLGEQHQFFNLCARHRNEIVIRLPLHSSSTGNETARGVGQGVAGDAALEMIVPLIGIAKSSIDPLLLSEDIRKGNARRQQARHVPGNRHCRVESALDRRGRRAKVHQAGDVGMQSPSTSRRV